MKAARFHAARDVRVEDVPEPGDLGPDELLVRPRWCGICGTDVHEYVAGPTIIPEGPHELTGSTIPQILGHEFSGDVVAVGSDVRSAKVGDRVSIMPLVYCGRCAACRNGQGNVCPHKACVGLSWKWGGLAELCVVADYMVNVMPDDITYEQGALIEPAAVGVYAVDRGEVRPGDVVFVTGAGPIGALSALAAQAAGAAEVLISEPNPERRAQAEKLGLGIGLDPAAAPVGDVIAERTKGVGVDVALECAGNEHAFAACVDALKSSGHLVQVGIHPAKSSLEPFWWNFKELTIRGTWGYKVSDWPRFLRLVASGRFPIERMVTAEIGLDKIVDEGLEILADPKGSHLKVLVAADA